MKVQFGRVCLAIWFAAGGLGQAEARAQNALTAAEVIEKAVARGEGKKRNATPDFQYTKCTVTEERDSAGKLRERREKVYEIAYRNGLPSSSLLRVNGRAPTAEDRKKQSESETNLRQLLGQNNGGKNDPRDHFLTPELVARFQFTLVGRTNVNGRAAYALSFQAKHPEPPVRRMVDRLLNRISGTLCIDAEEFEIARADIVLRSEVSLLGGLLGTLRKFDYTMVRTRMADGVWIGTLSSGDFEGRKFLDSMRIKTKTEALNFRPVAMTGNVKRET